MRGSLLAAVCALGLLGLGASGQAQVGAAGQAPANADDGVVGEALPAPGTMGALPVAVQSLLRLENNDRAAAGLAPLEWDAHLYAAAGRHVSRMADAEVLEHQFAGEPDVAARAAAAGARFSVIAENIAYAGDPEAIERQWMNSPGHRANILDPRLTRVGIATVLRGGTLYAVADYARAVAVLTPEQVEAEVGRKIEGLPRAVSGLLQIAPDPAEARAYCAGHVPAGGEGKPPVVVTWQGPSLELPEQLKGQLAGPEYSEAAVGACPAVSVENGGFAAYRVAVLLR